MQNSGRRWAEPFTTQIDIKDQQRTTKHSDNHKSIPSKTQVLNFIFSWRRIAATLCIKNKILNKNQSGWLLLQVSFDPYFLDMPIKYLFGKN